MALKHDSKGVISIVDAMAFITLISLVSLSLFAFCPADVGDEPMAKDICEKFVSVELKASDVFETDDSEVYEISTLIAAHMASDGNDDVELYIDRLIESLVPKPYGFYFEISTADGTMCFAREGSLNEESDFSISIGTYGNKTVEYHLKIY